MQLYFFLLSNIFYGAKVEKTQLFFSHERGFYYQNFTLTITASNPTAVIKFTIDGTNPSISKSAKAISGTATINIDPTNFVGRDKAPGFIISACTIDEDTLTSDIVTQTYIFPKLINQLSIDNQLPGANWLAPGGTHDISYGMDPNVYNNPLYSNKMEEAFTSIPSFSIVTDLRNLFDPDSGIYVNALYHGSEWERQTSLELITPNGSEGFQINCGLRIRGGWSRHYDNPKHAFRLFFRSKYGKAKLEYPLFGEEGVDEFDKIDLRTSQNYSWSYKGNENNTFMREIFSRDTQKDMGQPYTRSRFYHLFINGTYWGLYQTQERSEASFAESYFGGNKNDYDVIKVDVGEDFDVYHIEATDGTLEKWKQLWEAGEAGFSKDVDYFRIQGLNPDLSPNPLYEKLLDVDNLIDYMIITLFTGDFDGPISGFRNNSSPNNFYAIYSRINPDGFKFFRHDGEHTLFFNNWGIDRTGPYSAGENFLDSNPQWIHQKLSENENYRLRFADRVYKHLFDKGALTLTNNIERIKNRKAEIETAIIAESARWGDSKTSLPLTKIDWENAIDFIINEYLPIRKNVVLEQLKSKGLFTNITPPNFNLKGGIVEKGTSIELSTTNGDIYYTTDGNDPYSPVTTSNSNFSKEVITNTSIKKVIVPKYSLDETWKSSLNFNDSNWLTCSGINGGIGYDEKGDYNQYISLNVKSDMHESAVNPNTSCYIRIPFYINAGDIDAINYMLLNIMVDDGFAAYINGVEVAKSNVTEPLFWNSATPNYMNSTGFIQFDISEFIALLHSGDNLLAIQGVNTSLQSSDFLILPKLTVGNSSNSGSISPSAKLYQNPIQIEETTTIKARSISNGNWSPLNEIKYVINENLNSLKITEIHYHPLDQIAGVDTINGKEFEFIEIKNISPNQLNLSGSAFVNGISFTYPKGYLLGPKQFSILASNADEFNNRYGFLPDGEYTGHLNNSGERIVFVNAAIDTIFNFKYSDKSPWPEEADGKGYSLVSAYTNPTGSPNNYYYWNASGLINGSPSTDDIVSDVSSKEKVTPTKFVLSQNFPNPFNPSTTINYSIPNEGKVKIKIYDLLGREVFTLLEKKQKAGNYSIQFDANSIEQQISSGIYFCKLESGTFSKTIKMVLLK